MSRIWYVVLRAFRADERIRVMQEVKLTLPMLPDMELTASKTAGALGEHIGMSPDKIEEIQGAVVEACINAFEHSETAKHEVFLRFRVLGSDNEPAGLQITVQDSGVGFDVESVTDRKKQPQTKLPRKRGHGLRIIKGLMDEVVIQSDADGTTVMMRKMR